MRDSRVRRTGMQQSGIRLAHFLSRPYRRGRRALLCMPVCPQGRHTSLQLACREQGSSVHERLFVPFGLQQAIAVLAKEIQRRMQAFHLRGRKQAATGLKLSVCKPRSIGMLAMPQQVSDDLHRKGRTDSQDAGMPRRQLGAHGQLRLVDEPEGFICQATDREGSCHPSRTLDRAATQGGGRRGRHDGALFAHIAWPYWLGSGRKFMATPLMQ